MGYRQSGTATITLGGLVVVACVLAVAGYQVAKLDTSIANMIRSRQEEERMQTLTEVVTRPDGRQVTVTTTRGENETTADFIARHDATVAALKQDG